MLHHKTGTFPGQNFGIAMDGVGDVDGDGRADYAVGAPGWDAALLGWPVTGEVLVYSGATGTELFALHGNAPRDLFGCEIAALGDADGDGAPDLAVCSSPFNLQTGFYGNGSVRVHSLADGAALHDYPVAGSIDYDITTFVSAAGDVNGDGLRELLVGAHVANDTGVEAGEAQVLWIGNAKCGSLASFGASCVGSGGSAPQLTITGCPAAGGSMTLSIANGPPSSVALLAISFGPSALSIGAGCSWYLAGAPVILGPLPLGGLGPGQGGFSLTATIPLGTPPLTLVHQAIVLDPGAPLGFTTTSGVKEVIP